MAVLDDLQLLVDMTAVVQAGHRQQQLVRQILGRRVKIAGQNDHITTVVALALREVSVQVDELGQLVGLAEAMDGVLRVERFVVIVLSMKVGVEEMKVVSIDRYQCIGDALAGEPVAVPEFERIAVCGEFFEVQVRRLVFGEQRQA